MRYVTHSPEYIANSDSLMELEVSIPMTLSERNKIREWVQHGYDIDSNPWNAFEEDGSSMNYLKAYRIKFGASHGPWDSWEYESYWSWDQDNRELIRQ